jgi:hypothetical protein
LQSKKIVLTGVEELASLSVEYIWLFRGKFVQVSFSPSFPFHDV